MWIIKGILILLLTLLAITKIAKVGSKKDYIKVTEETFNILEIILSIVGIFIIFNV